MMIWVEQCTCGHDRDDHIHRCAECAACDCGVFEDQNDLDRRLNDASPEVVVG